MIEDLKEIDNIYDLMALCGLYILREDRIQPYDFSGFMDDNYDELYDAVEAYCCAINDKGKRRAFAEFKRYISNFLKSGFSVERCFAVLKYADELVEAEIPCHLFGNHNVINYSCMNKKYCDEIRIVPRRRDSFFSRKAAEMKEREGAVFDFFRKSRKCTCSALDNEILNYMIWDKEKIENFPFTIYYFSEKHSITKHFLKSEKLTFAIIPFIEGELEDIFGLYFGTKTFEIQNMNPFMEEKLKKRYQEIHKKCEGINVDFLIFPEMLMTEGIMKDTVKRKDFGSPWLVINGSIWKNLVNKSYLMNGKGEQVMSYCKKEPFVYKDLYTEHLDRTQNLEFSILEIEKFGRIGIGICKDLVSEKVKMFHKYIGTNLLFIPAYTDSMDLQSGAGELSRDYNCIVVVANACSALSHKSSCSEGKRIGFISLPAKKNKDRTEGIVAYHQDRCREACNYCCAGKLITIDFNQKGVFDFGITYEVEKSAF